MSQNLVEPPNTSWRRTGFQRSARLLNRKSFHLHFAIRSPFATRLKHCAIGRSRRRVPRGLFIGRCKRKQELKNHLQDRDAPEADIGMPRGCAAREDDLARGGRESLKVA
jgi:hypothetical protein